MPTRHVLGRLGWLPLLLVWVILLPVAVLSARALERTEGVTRFAAAAVSFVAVLILWAQGKYTVVSVDRSARTLITQRRFYGVTLTEAALELDEITDVGAQRRGRAARLFLRTRHGDVLLARVPSRRADAEVVALKRLLFE